MTKRSVTCSEQQFGILGSGPSVPFMRRLAALITYDVTPDGPPTPIFLHRGGPKGHASFMHKSIWICA
jgi:hypothetical protein